MQKRLNLEDLINTDGPMNSVALDDALHYLGLENKTVLTPHEEHALRAKKKKIVTSSKKLDRRVSRELVKRADRIPGKDK